MKSIPVVFDMDGVLINSEALFDTCWRQSILQTGHPVKEDVLQNTIGVDTEEVRRVFLSGYGEDFPYEACEHAMRERYRTQLETVGVPPMPGAIEILSALKEQGCPLALASSNLRYLIDAQLETAGLLSFFDAIVCAEDVAEGKPSPAVYEKACEALRVPPETAYAVEDAPAGVLSAYRAGMRVVMVPNLIAPTPEERRVCTLIAPSLGEVLAYFRQL